MQIRKITIDDIDAVMRIFSEARQAQRAAGFVQWGDEYPSVEVLMADMDSGNGYVLVDGGRIAGYVAITTYDEEYERHPRLWGYSKSYAVFHRIAISDEYRGKGQSKILFDLAEEKAGQLCVECIRIDTGAANKVMQHILTNRGYTDLGTCNFVWGERLAFEKLLG